MLPFEPPAFGAGATIGGTIACGFSGPARPYRGAARDFVLGVNCVSGRGEYLRFGGQVMKNVAGYDVSRLMVGAMGTLGVMTEVSLKVLPLPVIERTLVFDCSGNDALTKMTDLGGRPLPVTGTVWHDGKLRVRLSGSEMAVESAASSLGGDLDIAGASFWQALKEHRLDFFGGTDPLWRLSIAPPAKMPDLPGESLVEWGGALFWVRGNDPQALVALARAHGGNLTRFRGAERSVSFQPLGEAEAVLNRGLKQAFDPAGILNPDRMLAGS
jgi:glycolate oxidase FAD binding subunit